MQSRNTETSERSMSPIRIKVADGAAGGYRPARAGHTQLKITEIGPAYILQERLIPRP